MSSWFRMLFKDPCQVFHYYTTSLKWIPSLSLFSFKGCSLWGCFTVLAEQLENTSGCHLLHTCYSELPGSHSPPCWATPSAQSYNILKSAIGRLVLLNTLYKESSVVPLLLYFLLIKAVRGNCEQQNSSEAEDRIAHCLMQKRRPFMARITRYKYKLAL